MEFSGPRHGGCAREQGKTFGPPGKLKPVKVEAARRMREGGASFRRVAAGLECSASTVLRVLRK
jgi:DNA invertase Pin-like site-specific DNA recombinase